MSRIQNKRKMCTILYSYIHEVCVYQLKVLLRLKKRQWEITSIGGNTANSQSVGDATLRIPESCVERNISKRIFGIVEQLMQKEEYTATHVYLL